MSSEDHQTGDGPEPAERDADGGDDLPLEVVDEAERLTRLARNAIDEREAENYRERREDVLDAHDFTARIRDEQTGEVLVVHPAEWHADGTIRTDRIDDLSRAVERPLEGPEQPDDWDALDEANRDLVTAVRAAHGDVHGDNAATFADFVGNHYAKSMTATTRDEIEEFLGEYYVRNAWPSDEQRAVIDESIRLVFETAGDPVPEFEVH